MFKDRKQMFDWLSQFLGNERGAFDAAPKGFLMVLLYCCEPGCQQWRGGLLGMWTQEKYCDFHRDWEIDLTAKKCLCPAHARAGKTLP